MRVTPQTDVGKMAEQFITGLNALRAAEASPLTHHVPRLADTDASRAGLSAATSALQIGLEQATGDALDRAVAREIARVVVRAFEDQVLRIAGRQS